MKIRKIIFKPKNYIYIIHKINFPDGNMATLLRECEVCVKEMVFLSFVIFLQPMSPKFPETSFLRKVPFPSPYFRLFSPLPHPSTPLPFLNQSKILRDKNRKALKIKVKKEITCLPSTTEESLIFQFVEL